MAFKTKIIINNKLELKIFTGKNRVLKIEGIFHKNMKIQYWSELDTILSQCKNCDELLQEEDPQGVLNEIINLIEKFKHLSEKEEDKEKIEILKSQLNLYKTKCKIIYDNAIIVLAFLIFSHSKSTYKILGNFFKLPTIRHLQRLTSKFHVSPNVKNPENDEHYFNFLTQN